MPGKVPGPAPQAVPGFGNEMSRSSEGGPGAGFLKP